MSEIKPINWDALPKVWAYTKDELKSAKEAVFLEKAGFGGYKCLMKNLDIWWFDTISEIDPRIKTPKMRVMTAEELNDVYWKVGKDFRIRLIWNPSDLNYTYCLVDQDLNHNFDRWEYSIDRGVTWLKCEVEE